MGLGRVGKSRGLAAGNQAPVAVLPVRRICAGLLPVDEGRLITPVVYAAHGVQVRLAPDERVHQFAVLPGGTGPVGIVRLGQHIRVKVARGLLRLFGHRDGVSEELIEERRVPEPKPGNHDDRQSYLPRPGAQQPAGADDLTGLLGVSMPKTAAAEARSPCLRAIRIHIDEMTEPAPLDGDLLLVERLVANLLANAVRHNEADGRVEVTTGRRTARPSCR